MSPAGVEVSPLGDALGAEVHGVDVAAGVGEREMLAVRDALLRHSVVVLRDQRLGPEDQLAFVGRLWPLRPATSLSTTALPGHPRITVVSNVVEDGRPIGISDAGLLWHTDLCFTRTPELFASLYALEVPERDGTPLGDTLWVSAAAAYDDLPDDRRRLLAGRRACQSYAFHMEKMAALGLLTRPPLTGAQRAGFPEVEHPVVRTHPVTGRRLLYVNESFTARVVGLPAAESDALLEELWAHLVRPEITFRHRWRVGDLVLWDNCATQHHATFDYGDARRRLHRLGTAGPVPV